MTRMVTIITFTDTQSWAPNEDDDLTEIFTSVEYITENFREPLLTVGTLSETKLRKW